MILLFFRGGGDGSSGPVVADHKRIPNITRVATMPTLNRRRRRGR